MKKETLLKYRTVFITFLRDVAQRIVQIVDNVYETCNGPVLQGITLVVCLVSILLVAFAVTDAWI